MGGEEGPGWCFSPHLCASARTINEEQLRAEARVAASARPAAICSEGVVPRMSCRVACGPSFRWGDGWGAIDGCGGGWPEVSVFAGMTGAVRDRVCGGASGMALAKRGDGALGCRHSPPRHAERVSASSKLRAGDGAIAAQPGAAFLRVSAPPREPFSRQSCARRRGGAERGRVAAFRDAGRYRPDGVVRRMSCRAA